VIRIQNIKLVQGDFRLENISLQIEKGEYVVLMGKTGCGKTSLLEALCGLRSVSDGTIEIERRDVTHLKPAERAIGYVPQDGAVFDTMTVAENIGFALKIRKWPKAKIKQRVEELSGILGIGHLLERKPEGMSGGEKQRVALGRALSFYPEILCLDEPMSALDEPTRLEMYELIKKLKEEFNITALHISHSSHEAEMLADRVVVLEDGKLQDK
jgi:ABC-type sugar transport system ATPase subunit